MIAIVLMFVLWIAHKIMLVIFHMIMLVIMLVIILVTMLMSRFMSMIMITRTKILMIMIEIMLIIALVADRVKLQKCFAQNHSMKSVTNVESAFLALTLRGIYYWSFGLNC